jgi:nucleoid-associated protein YgaU
MAILNGLYIHVVDEALTAEVDTTSHPVESGIPTTDTIRVKGTILSLSGKIVDYGKMTATQVITKINSLKDSGSFIEYRGRNVVSSLQIQSFETEFPNTNSGGADFSMELKQVRIAKSAYVPKKATAKDTAAKKNPTIKVGSIVVFKGGNVYASSDAKKAASTRGRSTCKCTKINTKSWATHQYHLISTDGKKVYGWVDKKNIEGTSTTSSSTNTSGKTNAGTQQIKKGTKVAIYHVVKKGDTLVDLVYKRYKSLNTTTTTVMKNNPHAFSKPNQAKTLQIGARLLMGYRDEHEKNTKPKDKKLTQSTK